MSLYREGFRDIRAIHGSLVFVGGVKDARCGEAVTLSTGKAASVGQIVSVEDDVCAVQVFDSSLPLEIGQTIAWMERDAVKIHVGESLRGRVLNGLGRPVGGSIHLFEESLPVGGFPLPPQELDPAALILCEPVETGMSALDLTATVMMGQTLSLISEPGLPAGRVAALIAASARINSVHVTIQGKDPFLVVFAAVGVTGFETDTLTKALGQTMDDGVFIVSKAGSSAAERVVTPRSALSVAEYFAFVKGHDVLLVVTDMQKYQEASNEVNAMMESACGGRPVFGLRSLTEIYGRPGRVSGRPGSVTKIFVLSAPPSSPAANLAARLADGTAILTRQLDERGIFPPFDMLASTSRLMSKGIGRGLTFDAHGALANQLRESISKAQGSLSGDERYIAFSAAVEKLLIDQKLERRSFAQSETLAWEALSELTSEELHLLPKSLLARKLKSDPRQNLSEQDVPVDLG
jgi:V/A-type H+-transporting ATPase subunit B